MVKEKKWFQNLRAQAALISILCVITAGIIVWRDISELRLNNKKYEGEIKRKDEYLSALIQRLSRETTEIKRLETRFAPFRAIALEKYPGPEQEALRKLADKLADVKIPADLLKDPISFALAEVEVAVQSSQEVAAHYKSEGGFLGFVKDCRFLLVTLDTQSYANQNGKGEVVYKGVFLIQPGFSAVGEPVEILREADMVRIMFRKIPENSRVTGGKASVSVNGNIRFEFEIPPQKMQGENIIIREINSRSKIKSIREPDD
ncbi:MAG: hypothetical protein PHC33_01825 [Candidatus Omnitrophica bacterium]|nr:hypothetical protein [Candidatus Omnitrophota bacterium]